MLNSIVRPVLAELSYQIFVVSPSDVLDRFGSDHFTEDALAIGILTSSASVFGSLLVRRLHSNEGTLMLLQSDSRPSYIPLPADFTYQCASLQYDLSHPYGKMLCKEALTAQIRLSEARRRAVKLSSAARSESQSAGQGVEEQNALRTKHVLSLLAYEFIEEFDRKLTAEEIDLAAKAVFDFECTYSASHYMYVSASSQRIFKWMMTLAEYAIADEKKLALADKFKRHLSVLRSDPQLATSSSSNIQDLSHMPSRRVPAPARAGNVRKRSKPIQRDLGAKSLSANDSPLSTLASPDPKKVMVVHGRDERARRAMFTFLRSIELEPIEWTQAIAATGKGSPYIGEALDAAFSMAQAVIVLMTPDDEARLHPRYWKPTDDKDERQLTPQPRPNVIFEAGMAFGMHPNRTILVTTGEIRRISDIEGRHIVRLDNTREKQDAFAQRLRTAGCPVELSGAEWFTEDDFAQALGTISIDEYAQRHLPSEAFQAIQEIRNIDKVASPVVSPLESLSTKVGELKDLLDEPFLGDDMKQLEKEFRQHQESISQLRKAIVSNLTLNEAIGEFLHAAAQVVRSASRSEQELRMALTEVDKLY